MLLRDWSAQRAGLAGRKLVSLFFGGGTPSLFQPESFAQLLEVFAPDLAATAEITMEANPGSLEYGRLEDYRSAGINRLSIGVQSFDDAALARLGRIHSGREARVAIEAAHAAGFDNINIDLMHGLPRQGATAALADLHEAVGAEVEHISYYQLTIEPRTEFARRPPTLPLEDELAQIERQGFEALAKAGFERYEVSAYAKPDRASLHNYNYWEFGDYIGLGAGAHGKLSTRADDGLAIERLDNPRQPRLYLQHPGTRRRRLAPAERPVEFMMNALRLINGVPEALFEARTDIPIAQISTTLNKLRQLGYLREDRLALTPIGLNSLDTLVADFLE